MKTQVQELRKENFKSRNGGNYLDQIKWNTGKNRHRENLGKKNKNSTSQDQAPYNYSKPSKTKIAFSLPLALTSSSPPNVAPLISNSHLASLSLFLCDKICG